MPFFTSPRQPVVTMATLTLIIDNNDSIYHRMTGCEHGILGMSHELFFRHHHRRASGIEFDELQNLLVQSPHMLVKLRERGRERG